MTKKPKFINGKDDRTLDLKKNGTSSLAAMPESHCPPLVAKERRIMQEIELSKVPTPSAVQELMRDLRGQLRRCSKQRLQRLEENLKLRYYFGGLDVACIQKPDGHRSVVAAGLAGQGEITTFLESLTPEELARITLEYPDLWED